MWRFQSLSTQRPMTRAQRLWLAHGLCVLGGISFFLGWAGFGLWPLELLALVPLWAAIELASDRSWRTALGLGWLYGAVANAGGYHWLPELFASLWDFAWFLSLGAFLGFVLYLGLQYGIMAALYGTARGRGWSVAAAGLSSLLATEWLFPKLFPVFLSNALLQMPLLVQTADLGGPLLVSVLVGLVNVLVFECLRWTAGARPAPVAAFVITSAFVLFTLSYGVLRIAQIDARAEAAPSLEVGLVQASLVPGQRHRLTEKLQRHIDQSLALERQGELDLLVWPEASVGPVFGRTLPIEAHRLQGRLQTPLLFGGSSSSGQKETYRLYNTVFLADEQGLIHAMYDKIRVIMFGEYLPFGARFPQMYELFENTTHITRGSNMEALQLGPWRISTPVCYEDVLPGFMREMVNQANPHVLINLSNDAWFGNTQEPWIHLVLAQFRAIEHRRALLRATNTGRSAFIDPVGRIVEQTGTHTRENLRARVPMMQGQTVYGRFGDWPGWLALAMTVVTLLRRSPFKASGNSRRF